MQRVNGDGVLLVDQRDNYDMMRALKRPVLGDTLAGDLEAYARLRALLFKW